MKRSHKVINLLYILFFLALMVVSGVLVFGGERSVWETRRAEVIRCSEIAMDSFYSFTSMLWKAPSESQLRSLEKRILSMSDGIVQTIRISEELPKGMEALEERKIRASFSELPDGGAEMEVLCRAEYLNRPFYLLLKSDFTDLSKERLKKGRIYAAAAAAVVLFGGAFFVLLNLLWAETEKSKRFMENFNHEMKTPMTSVLGYTEMLRTMPMTEEETNHALDALSFEANRLNHLSSQMLNLFITQNEKPELSPTATGEIQNDLAIPLKSLSEKYGIPYAMQLEEAEVLCNKDLLLLLITNLADNAFKATVNAESNETVWITGKADDAAYQIAVKDRGVGISKKHLKRITEPFYREDKARSRAQGGAGLGLSLCSEIARIHGGDLSFSSRKGFGTMAAFPLKRSGV